MSGEALYALYVEEHEKRDCECDPWEDLSEFDREVWNAMAARLTDSSMNPR